MFLVQSGNAFGSPSVPTPISQTVSAEVVEAGWMDHSVTNANVANRCWISEAGDQSTNI